MYARGVNFSVIWYTCIWISGLPFVHDAYSSLSLCITCIYIPLWLTLVSMPDRRKEDAVAWTESWGKQANCTFEVAGPCCYLCQLDESNNGSCFLLSISTSIDHSMFFLLTAVSQCNGIPPRWLKLYGFWQLLVTLIRLLMCPETAFFIISFCA